ncbi:MAG: DUF192 domain-containing protein [Coriobacteriales bacterium]|jgi:uncharacterized membrane protein (UPF0127 family)|nr:DUF192 domain-containing protein [Coriobacteriales bacterium]
MSTGYSFVLASSLFARMRGLLSSSICPNGSVLVLIPCSSIHTLGMREALDIAFIDRQGTILRSERNVAPMQLRSCRGAVATLERRALIDTPWFSQGDVVEIGYKRNGANYEDLSLL